MSRLLDAAGDCPFLFIVGKGGVGKTTTAGAAALELADAGTDTHLISTDPAHSLGDLFGERIGSGVTSACSPHLYLEELDAATAADQWLERALAPVSQLVELGTYLDAEDVGAFSRLALPGVDEAMAVLRLAGLAGGTRRVVVDTAPTGHTLRMLDAAALHEGIARALRAMADKADAVGGAMTGHAVRLSGESIIDELQEAVTAYRERVLAPAAFVIVTRHDAVVAAGTSRLADELRQRSLSVRAVVVVGGHDVNGIAAPAGARLIAVPLLDDVTGCDGLRRWRAPAAPARREHAGIGRSESSGPRPLLRAAPPLLLFAGKGGVGKSTCAAAAALLLADDREVLLCSTDPAGSLEDVLRPGTRLPSRLRAMQIDPAAQLEELYGSYRDEVMAALERLGLAQSAALDRRVIEALWDLAPPGLDEMAGTAALLRAARADDTLVIDSAPTGHFLRLLEMPETALGWTRQLMRVIVKYGLAGVAERAAQSLIDLSRELKGLQSRLHDPERAAVLVVTLEEPMVTAETDRLIATLEQGRVRIGALIVNRARDTDRVGRRHPLVLAPEMTPPPAGVDGLRGFAEAWKIVT